MGRQARLTARLPLVHVTEHQKADWTAMPLAGPV